MEVLSNKFGGRIVLVLALFLAFSTSAFAQEAESDLTFFEKLKEQEVKEHRELLDKIKSMDDQGYRKVLSDRINDSYKQRKGGVSGFVIVDVTEEMKQPEPGFFAKLFTSPPIEEEYGINRVETLLDSTEVGKGWKLKLRKKFSSTDKKRNFQWIEGEFSKGDAKKLVAKKQIVDLHVTEPKYPAWSNITAFDLSTGRVLPPRSEKEYSEEFISEGVYQDLIKKFDKKPMILVRIDFSKPESYVNSTYTEQDRQAQLLSVEEFLKEWSEFEFAVMDKGEFHLYLETSKAHLDAMKGHSFIASIGSGDSLLLQSIRSD